MENVIIFGTGNYYLHRKNRKNPNYQGKLLCLKSDCEGSEYDIFGLLDKSGVLSKIIIIMMEWHYIYFIQNFLRQRLLDIFMHFKFLRIGE